MSITYPIASVTKPDNLRFTFKEIRSDAMGLKVLTIPTRTGPAERLSSQTIPGRSGSLILSEGVDIFDDISIATNVFLEHPSVEQLDALSVWYRGQGELNFNYNPWYQQAGYFIATCAAQPAFSPIVKGCDELTMALQWACKPYYYLESGRSSSGRISLNSTTTEATATNPGNIASAPLVRLRANGSGGGIIMFGTSGAILVNDDNHELNGNTLIIVDTETRMAWSPTVTTVGNVTYETEPYIPMTKYIGIAGDWPRLPVGQSAVAIDGSIGAVTVIPRWRCI